MTILLNEFIKGMRIFGKKISVFVNTLLLSVVYLLGIGITALVAKVAGKHFLNITVEKDRSSYWEDINFTNKKIEEFLKQY